MERSSWMCPSVRVCKWLESVLSLFTNKNNVLISWILSDQLRVTLQIHPSKYCKITPFFLIDWYCQYKCILRSLIRYTYILAFLFLFCFFVLDLPSCTYLKLLTCVVFCIFVSMLIGYLPFFSLASREGVPFPCFSFLLNLGTHTF